MNLDIRKLTLFQRLGFLIIFCMMSFATQAACDYTTTDDVIVSQDIASSGGTQYYYIFDCDGDLAVGPITSTDFGMQPYGCYRIYAINSCPGPAPSVNTTADVAALPAADYSTVTTREFTVCDNSLLGTNGGVCEGDDVTIVSIPNSYDTSNDMTYVLVCSIDGGAETITGSPVTISAGTTPAQATFSIPEDNDVTNVPPYVPSCVIHVLNHCPTANLTALVDGADWLTVDPTGDSDVTAISAATTLENCVGLPLDLVSFTADCKADAVKLEWTTVNEENVKEMIVQRSLDGTRFMDLEVLVAKSNGLPIKTTYSYMDQKPLSQGLYRLKILDMDGSFEYSPLRQIKCLSGGFDFTEIFPNPTKKDITINFEIQNLSSSVTLRLVDVLGRVVHVEEVTPRIGINTLVIDMSNLGAAIYTVILDDGKNQVTRRIIKE